MRANSLVSILTIIGAAIGSGAALADGRGSSAGSVKDAAPMRSTYNWTGGYFGLHLGSGWGDSKITEDISNITGLIGGLLGPVAIPSALTSSHGVDGFIGGVHLGGRRQFGNFVIGAELSVSGSGISGTGGNCMGVESLIAGLGAPPGLINTQCKTDVNWLATGLAKAGYAFNNVLVYGAAGYSIAGLNNTFTLGIPLAPISLSFAKSEVADGWALGGGAEYAFGNGFSLGFEYLYRDLEAKGEGLLLGGIITNGKRELELHSFTTNLNYKF